MRKASHFFKGMLTTEARSQHNQALADVLYMYNIEPNTASLQVSLIWEMTTARRGVEWRKLIFKN